MQTSLHYHYDEENAQTSLAWFVAQARAGAGPSVPMTTKSDFAGQVLNEWKFIDQFNLINAESRQRRPVTRGCSTTSPIRWSSRAGEYDLKQRYIAMETYFNTLLGMQIKCATLIMNAYDQLGNDPASTDGYTALGPRRPGKRKCSIPSSKRRRCASSTRSKEWR